MSRVRGKWTATWYEHGATEAHVEKFDSEAATYRWIMSQRQAKRSGTVYTRTKKNELFEKLVIVAGEIVA